MSLGSDDSEDEVLPTASVFLGPLGRAAPISLLSSDSEDEAPPTLCERLRRKFAAQSSAVPASPARKAPAPACRPAPPPPPPAPARGQPRGQDGLKQVAAVLDPALLQADGGGQVLSALQALGCACAIEPQPVAGSMAWRRRAAGPAQAEEESWTEEPNVLLLLHTEEFVSMIYNYKQVPLQEVQSSTDGQKETLRSFVARVMEKIPGKTLALAVVELEKYLRSHKSQSQKRPRQAVPNGSQKEGQRKRKRQKEKEASGPEVSRLDVEEALVDLQLHTGIQVRCLENWKDLSDFATMFTKSVAEAPFKRERENTGFSFYLENEWCRGVKVDRSGKGLLQAWQRQIQQFHRVSPDMASAIVSAYPSPWLLEQAYRRCFSEQEQQNMLADIPVRRGDGVTATSRRIGPELSRRIFLQMTSHNPDLYLDVTN
ncbi:crossover junction endonuclease EME1 [Alligator mississippiensis]|uniref:crossover junction endonuclease EME1 n=1 Tax=Alligator mississippiensis TaxID=8496 RepID=UPI0009072399|nr:crossover junction endonuclease EME1 [Alligator mississippiensis]